MPRAALSADELAHYRDHIQEAIRRDGLVCLECGILCWRLGKHVEAHGLTSASYRAQWGYPPETPLALPIPPEMRRPPRRVPPTSSSSPWRKKVSGLPRSPVGFAFLGPR